jgi:hypothetical protein
MTIWHQRQRPDRRLRRSHVLIAGKNQTGCRRRDVDNKEVSATDVTLSAITEQ